MEEKEDWTTDRLVRHNSGWNQVASGASDPPNEFTGNTEKTGFAVSPNECVDFSPRSKNFDL
jgi:hypothetical protein